MLAACAHPSPHASVDPAAGEPDAGALHQVHVDRGLPRTEIAPHVFDSTITVNGRLPPEVIQGVVREYFRRSRACHESALRDHPDLNGFVTVKFVIQRDGSVAAASDHDSTLTDHAVVQCFVDAFGQMSFPAPEGGIVTVVYPIELAPE